MDRVRLGIKQLLAERKDAMRAVVRGLDADELNWTPFDAAEQQRANSIAQLVLHALDAERFLVAVVAGVRLSRDRESHFRATTDSSEQLLDTIDRAEREIAGFVDRITLDRLSEDVRIVEPTWDVPDVTRTGTYWLLHAIEHTSEHIGQAMLTRQMYEQRNPR